MNVNEFQIDVLKKFGVDMGNSIDDLLLNLDAKITEIGFDKDCVLNEDGLTLQKIYDVVYSQNR